MGKKPKQCATFFFDIVPKTFFRQDFFVLQISGWQTSAKGLRVNTLGFAKYMASDIIAHKSSHIQYVTKWDFCVQ